MSSDHVNVAIHEFGGNGRPLLLSHATGFHGYCYLPIADRLDQQFTSYALDYRGHGATPCNDDWDGDWFRYGDDALAAARRIAPDGGLIGFGHSMGATGLLMAAHREPGLFDLIIGFEPIVFPTAMPDDGGDQDGPPSMVEGARRRRPTFPSFEAAVDNYASKPPFQFVDSDMLRLYVAHGFRPSPEGVRLKCDPAHEALTFMGGAGHRLWDALPEIDTRVVVIGGGDGEGPAQIAPGIAERLPDCLFISQPDSTHFGPFVDPAGTADLIVDLTAGLTTGLTT
jgi:pimeloyl-ACP methyl ester carboxylesterase